MGKNIYEVYLVIDYFEWDVFYNDSFQYWKLLTNLVVNSFTIVYITKLSVCNTDNISTCLSWDRPKLIWYFAWHGQLLNWHTKEHNGENRRKCCKNKERIFRNLEQYRTEIFLSVSLQIKGFPDCNAHFSYHV